MLFFIVVDYHNFLIWVVESQFKWKEAQWKAKNSTKILNEKRAMNFQKLDRKLDKMSVNELVLK